MKKWIKGIVAFLGAALLLVSCGGQGGSSSSVSSDSAPSSHPAPVPIFASADEYPKVDGSTANLPLMAQVMADTCGISLEEAQSRTSNTGTNYAWSNLTEGYADLLLVYEAPEEMQKQVEESGVELEITPVGRDALVFLVNEANPVKELTTDQLRDIYTGKVTNWKDVGGNDEGIVPFQRNSTSGSQTMFLKLLMQDTKPMDPPQDLMIGGMAGLIEQVADYDNGGGAIGYSVYYYASLMYQKPELRILSVNDVEPSAQPIKDGSYPLLNDFYLVIRKDEPVVSAARQLRDWILSDNGRQAFTDQGYVPIF